MQPESEETQVIYVIRGGERTRRLEISIDQAPAAPAEPPAWTELGFMQCPHCPLDPETVRHCPLALSLVGLVQCAEGFVSWHPVEIEVTAASRTIHARSTAQRVFGSVMGVLSAVSGCPHTAWFQPMARFHLPLATIEETLMRVVGMYATAQHLRGQMGLPADVEMTGLPKLYEAVEMVNIGIAGRLRTAVSTDASLNALIVLDLAAKSVPMSLEDGLAELRPLFQPLIDRDPA